MRADIVLRNARTASVVEKASLHGTTRMRGFVEVDPRASMRSFQRLKPVMPVARIINPMMAGIHRRATG